MGEHGIRTSKIYKYHVITSRVISKTVSTRTTRERENMSCFSLFYGQQQAQLVFYFTFTVGCTCFSVNLDLVYLFLVMGIFEMFFRFAQKSHHSYLLIIDLEKECRSFSVFVYPRVKPTYFIKHQSFEVRYGALEAYAENFLKNQVLPPSVARVLCTILVRGIT